jgi:hypothetical protein
MPDIQLEEEREAAGELLRPPQRGDPSLAGAAGVGVRDQPALEERLADVHDRVVQHALGEAGGRDDTLLGVVNDELPEPPDREGARTELGRHACQVLIEVTAELLRLGARALAAQRPRKGQAQVVAVEDPLKQRTRSPHRRPSRIERPLGEAAPEMA